MKYFGGIDFEDMEHGLLVEHAPPAAPAVCAQDCLGLECDAEVAALLRVVPGLVDSRLAVDRDPSVMDRWHAGPPSEALDINAALIRGGDQGIAEASLFGPLVAVTLRPRDPLEVCAELHQRACGSAAAG